MDHYERDPDEVPAEDLAEERLSQRDESPVSPPRDLEVPEGDALDQGLEVVPGERRTGAHDVFDAPEADAQEQAIEVPLDDDGLAYEG